MKIVRPMCCLLLLALTLVACDSSEEKSEVLAAPDTSIHGVDGNCVAPPEWFRGSVPAPQPQLFPQDGVTNCDFHLISWQYFLWLTQDVGGKLRLETLFTDRAIHPGEKNDTNHVLDITEQALSRGILVDRNGRAVYASIIINDIYRDWVIANKLYDPEEFAGFSATADFPVGSMSLKAAWKIVQPGEVVSNLYTTQADIYLLETGVDGTPGIPQQNPKLQKGVQVALVGLHIAVVVRGHPEFIWATFEYDNNAPDFNAEQARQEAVSTKDWLFYQANTVAQKTNANNASTLAFVDEVKQTLDPVTQVARQYPNGGGEQVHNQENIEHLNADVKKKLASSAVWKNYFEVGAVWFNTANALKPNWNPNTDPALLTGSTRLSNAVIETFTQKVRSANECFSCHNTYTVTSVPPNTKILPGKNANTSHVLLKNYQGGGEVKRGN